MFIQTLSNSVSQDATIQQEGSWIIPLCTVPQNHPSNHLGRLLRILLCSPIRGVFNGVEVWGLTGPWEELDLVSGEPTRQFLVVR